MSGRGLSPVSNLSGGGGGGGGGSTLPALPGADGTYDLVVASGVGSWQLVGGDRILSFAGIARTTEVGTSFATFAWTATYNTPPSAVTISWTGVATGSAPAIAPFTSGTITGPFLSNANAGQLVVTLTATMPDGTHTATQVVLWAAKVVFGSITPPETPGQTLWNALNASGNQLHATRGGAYSFASPFGEDQVFGLLASLGTPTLKDPATGFTYPPTLVAGSPANITENGTTQSFNFWTAANPGSTIVLDMT